MQKYFVEARTILSLAIPVIIAQISQTAIGVVDTIMAGTYSATDMAAVAVGTSIWLPAILFGRGLLLALISVIAQLNGAGRRDHVAYQVYQGYWMAAAVSIFILLVLYSSKFAINIMHNIDRPLLEKAITYLHIIMWGAPGYLFFQVLRAQCEGLSKTKPGMVIGVISLLIHLPINYVFIYGKCGMPELGGIGCGVATASIYWIMFLLMCGYVKHAPSQRDIKIQIDQQQKGPDKIAIKNLLFLGIPIAMSLFFEVTLFAVVALLVSPLGIVAVAGHQIALNFSSLMFVLPMSLGVSVTIRIGHRLGEGSVENARISACSALAMGIVIACGTAWLTITLRKSIALLYNDSPAVVAMASQLMLFAAVYQISDSIQVIGSGVLRGYKDTSSIFFITFLAYWVFGLPVGYLLGLTDILIPAMGPRGFWMGFIVGLTFSALMIVLRMQCLQKQPSTLILQRSSR